jgi:hypothetical protein
MVVVGQVVEFDPLAHCDGNGAEFYKGDVVLGEVVYVNYKHRWFSVEYGCPALRTSFKFCDIGTEVRVYG